MAGNRSQKELKLQNLFEEAHKDRSLKIRLLSDPEKVAKERGIEFGKREVERLKKVGAVVEMLNEAKIGRVFRCDPRVCYPVTLWLKVEILDLIKEIVVVRPPGGGVTYPGPIIDRVSNRLDRNLDLSGRVKGGVIIDS